MVNFKRIGERIENERGRLCIVISGSRMLKEKQPVIDYVNSLPEDCRVLFGDAKAGVDVWVKQRVLARNLEHKEYVADWAQYGRSAGAKRNRQMIRDLCTWHGERKVVCFWDGQSPGTKIVIDIAEEFGFIVERR